MEPTILAAIIAALGAVIAAYIAKGRPHSPKKTMSESTSPSNHIDIEAALRTDPRVQRLLANSNWCHTAEAAIANLVHNIAPPVKSWPSTPTWQQVAAVYDENRGA